MANLVSKRDIGQRVWSIKNDKAFTFLICGVSLHVSSVATTEYYTTDDYTSVPSEKCFDTKEELIASIFDNEKGDI